MAFWGIEVKPGKPYVHNFDESRGRLRISQATLSDGESTSKSTVQCNIGTKSPILLCNLIPNVSETCHLELEFEEDDEVIFSVLGQRSVHLSGYYLGNGLNLHGDDTDSYGEDIAESDTSRSYSDGSEDEYESDFIDDGDLGMYSDSPLCKSSVVIEEIEDDAKQSNGNHNRHRLKKKHVIIDSDDPETGSQQLVVRNNSSSIVESEDEDGFPICFTVGSKNSKDKKKNGDKKRKIDAICQDTELLSKEINEPQVTSVRTDNASKPKKSKRKNKEKNEMLVKGSEADDNINRTKADAENKTEIFANHSTEKSEDQDMGSLNGAKDADKHCANGPLTSDAPDTGKRSKKKKKKKTIAEEGISDEKNSNNEVKLILADAQKAGDEKPIDNCVAADLTDGKKKKKKKNKRKDSDSDMKHESLAEEKSDLVNGVDNSKDGSQVLQTRTFPNGLIVEEVSMGKPDGKKASPGKKISVCYIGKLKNGTIFDSNIGQRPFKFRLGIGEVIKGWDIGVSGMRVGDKRRLTIPPSFGYGEKGVGKIPPNSWLVFDVELVDVQ